jgi:hypothetical protein
MQKVNCVLATKQQGKKIIVQMRLGRPALNTNGAVGSTEILTGGNNTHTASYERL